MACTANVWTVCGCSKSKLIVRESVSFSVRYTWNKCERIFFVRRYNIVIWIKRNNDFGTRLRTYAIPRALSPSSEYSHLKQKKKIYRWRDIEDKGKTSHYAECRPLTKCMIDDPKWLYWIMMEPRGSCMHSPIDQPRTLILFPFISSTCVIQNEYENIMPFRIIVSWLSFHSFAFSFSFSLSLSLFHLMVCRLPLSQPERARKETIVITTKMDETNNSYVMIWASRLKNWFNSIASNFAAGDLHNVQQYEQRQTCSWSTW